MQWFLANFLGVLILVPFGMAVSWRQFAKLKLQHRFLEAAVLFSVVAAVAIAGFHFGTLGASWVKWLYLLLGAVAPAVLSITGGVIWLVRTRKRARTRTTPSSLPSPVPSHP